MKLFKFYKDPDTDEKYFTILTHKDYVLYASWFSGSQFWLGFGYAKNDPVDWDDNDIEDIEMSSLLRIELVREILDKQQFKRQLDILIKRA